LVLSLDHPLDIQHALGISVVAESESGPLQCLVHAQRVFGDNMNPVVVVIVYVEAYPIPLDVLIVIQLLLLILQLYLSVLCLHVASNCFVSRLLVVAVSLLQVEEEVQSKSILLKRGHILSLAKVRFVLINKVDGVL
jgi:hypothetical protein